MFQGAGEELASHRGWDPGALPLARLMARRLGCPLLVVRWSRLLVESNRAPTNRRIWSGFTGSLPKEERNRILERWWRPHRESVESAVAAATRVHRVVHVAVHSFTAELNGEVRKADVALLYDSRRAAESVLCRQWAGIMRGINPGLRIRFNYPYRGCTDGLPTWLRQRHASGDYLGVELEINQAWVTSPGWRRFQEQMAEGLCRLMEE